MSSRYDILFEPVKIGPVTAKNRFYQVPHCNGLGARMPRALAAMRGIKAEGGWGVVNTEETQIHHQSDQAPYIEGALWDDEDIPYVKLMVDAVHEHGALAGCQPVFHCLDASNWYSRMPVIGPTSQPLESGSGMDPVQCAAMDKQDIRNVRKWIKAGAIRAMKAGYDIVYTYSETIIWDFLSSASNNRTDEYGGSLENRLRLFKEILNDTKEAVGHKCAIAIRLPVNELLGKEGMEREEASDIISSMAEVPDIWDVNLSGWENDSGASRFFKEGYQVEHMNFVKDLTTKPVVGVGRFTSPENMVSMVKNGVMDFIGAARPSIADPFIPNKIREERVEDIRECIGCNICITGDHYNFPIRCTQNPTMGEEYRRGWHPEKIAPAKNEKNIAVIGGGPAGLEAARALGQRGYTVALVDDRSELGGRVARESKLPGLIEWSRVLDYRQTAIEKMDNVEVYLESRMKAEDVLELGYKNVLIATGATWRRDGIGRYQWPEVKGHDIGNIFTPDDIMDGKIPSGNVVVYDNENYYLGAVVAEKLVNEGCTVQVVCPEPEICRYASYTMEQEMTQFKLAELNVEVTTQHRLDEIKEDGVVIAHRISGKSHKIKCDAIVLVTERIPTDSLYQELKPHLESGELETLEVIGDASAPSIIERAIFAGHNAAREFDEDVPAGGLPFKRERPGDIL
ncbi:MAG: FAD-dependent oxidoreductase [Bacteroidetes bacterium]|nr:FAD-dependent oxidoreductase [Bacteroidota bacterium]